MSIGFGYICMMKYYSYYVKNLVFEEFLSSWKHFYDPVLIQRRLPKSYVHNIIPIISYKYVHKQKSGKIYFKMLMIVISRWWITEFLMSPLHLFILQTIFNNVYHSVYLHAKSRSVQLLSRVRLFATPWIAAHQASVSITNSWSSFRLTLIASNSFWPWMCSPPGSSAHGILQAKKLEWVAVPFSRGSSGPRDKTWVFCTSRGFFTTGAPGKPMYPSRS